MRRKSAVLTAASLVASVVVVLLSPAPANALTQRWVANGGKFHWSSPVIADVDGNGSNDVVVGSSNGSVYAYNASGGLMWAKGAGGEVNSSPAVGDVDGDGANEVVVGWGANTSSAGGVTVFDGGGNVQCVFNVPRHPATGLAGVWNSPALGDVNGDQVNDIVFGAFNDYIYAVTGGCSKIADYNNGDTVWSAAALRNVDGDGEMEIFIGGDATASANGWTHSGGYYRSLEFNGSPTLAQRWVYPALETFQGSSAFGTIDGRLAVITNSGADKCRNHDARLCGEAQKVWAFDPANGNVIRVWTATYTTFLAGPAVGDIDGDGRDDVAVGSTRYTNNAPNGGAVDLFLSNGGTWTQRTYTNGNEITSPPIIAEVTGGGTPEVIASTNEAVILNSAGARIDGVALGWAHKAASAVGNLGGNWSLVTTGFEGETGHVGAYAIPAPPGGNAGPWTMYQKNARRLGSDPTDAAPIKCDQGYYLGAADGGIFTFGPQAPFYGSAGAIRLNAPIVGMTSNTDATGYRSGYWFVATDGGVFNYGPGSKFYGSTGAMHLNQPIVGMAARPQGDGYWLVARDGGIFTFGNAGFHGSTGAMRLNSPIVGMAARPQGDGYWLVAADGGIFTFGNAGFHGSTGAMHLNQPIVGMAPTKSGNGYWLVARDGGIFTFGDAGFKGSTGAMTLNQPIVGMQTTASGNGYWFVASDGGIFSFGDAEFCGSMGARRLNQPVVGMG